jgi:probable addiction module antidote protein
MKKSKKSAAVPFESVLDKHLKGASQKEVTAYLNECLSGSDDGLEILFLALNDLARAKGIKELADKTNVARDTYYKLLKGKNPTVNTFRSLLNGLDLDLSIIARKRA